MKLISVSHGTPFAFIVINYVTELALSQQELTMVTSYASTDIKTMAVMPYKYHMIAFLLVIKRQCLLLCGDVELNPGPLDQGTGYFGKH